MVLTSAHIPGYIIYVVCFWLCTSDSVFMSEIKHYKVQSELSSSTNGLLTFISVDTGPTPVHDNTCSEVDGLSQSDPKRLCTYNWCYVVSSEFNAFLTLEFHNYLHNYISYTLSRVNL